MDSAACPACDRVASVDSDAPSLLAMPGRGDALWTRVALAGTALATLAIAAWLLAMTIRNALGRG